MLNFELSIFKKVREGASSFASRHFPKSAILASCIFVGGHLWLAMLVLLKFCTFSNDKR